MYANSWTTRKTIINMRKNLLILIPLLLVACKKNESENSKNAVENAVFPTQQKEISVKIHTQKNTVRERFSPPENFIWIESVSGSYGQFIENFKLKPYGTKILKYDGTPIATQNLHEAVFDISVGNKDLQQCADAVIRLRAEYLKRIGKEDEIGFHYTSGDFLKWNEYKNGVRLFVNGNKVTRGSISANSSENSFQNYLDNIYNYAGTISVNRETKPVTKNSYLKTGDILITPGSPGHVVFIAGVAKNSDGKKVYLLGGRFHAGAKYSYPEQSV